MKIFKKRESLVSNMAYMGIMAAVNIIFVVLTYFIPFLLFVLVFVLPLCSAIISYYCKKRYFPIYLVVVMAVCLIIDLSDAIFYVLPSLITGFFFGLFIDRKAPPIMMIVVNTIIQFGLSLLAIPLIKLITNRDIINDFIIIFRLQDFAYVDYIKYGFVFFISFIQIVITYIVMNDELSKFGMDFVEDNTYTLLTSLIGIVFLGLSILFAFFVPEITFIFIFLGIIFAFDSLGEIEMKHYKVYVIELIIIVIASIFAVALIYPNIVKPFGILSFIIIPLLILIAAIINKYLLCKK